MSVSEDIALIRSAVACGLGPWECACPTGECKRSEPALAALGRLEQQAGEVNEPLPRENAAEHSRPELRETFAPVDGRPIQERGGSLTSSDAERIPDSAARETILMMVSAERDRQDVKWGGIPGLERRDEHTYAAVLGEEVGEACKAWLERDLESLREELVQVAAVAVAWLEEITNGGTVRG